MAATINTREIFFKQNAFALEFLRTATDDYIGARCGLLNGQINAGYIMAEQAIEKMLKSYILLLSPKEILRKKQGYPDHDLEPLRAKLQTLISVNLDPFKDLCFKLSKAYPFLRYPGNPHILSSGINSLSTAIIDEVDEFFLFLFENMPIPDEVRCFLSVLWITLNNKNITQIDWFIKGNRAYYKRVNYFSHTMEWWQMKPEERDNRSSITIHSFTVTQ